jgi:hypothetical protein
VVRHFGRSPVCDWQVIGPNEKLFSAFFMRLQVNPAVSVPQRSPLGGVFFCAVASVVIVDHQDGQLGLAVDTPQIVFVDRSA